MALDNTGQDYKFTGLVQYDNMGHASFLHRTGAVKFEPSGYVQCMYLTSDIQSLADSSFHFLSKVLFIFGQRLSPAAQTVVYSSVAGTLSTAAQQSLPILAIALLAWVVVHWGSPR